MQHIALFGGAFDPPHLGHVLCATYAFVCGGVDGVWVLPSARHPYGKAMAPWEQRWRLCQAAFGPLPFCTVRDDEQRNAPGFTFTLIERLRAENPGVRFSLVGGTDTAKDLRNWHRGAELAELIDIIAVPRRGYDDHPAALPAIASKDIRALLSAGGDADRLLPPGVATLIREHGWYR